MSYYNPITTIASVGVGSTPVPVTIVSNTAPTKRENGSDLRQGDTWWDPVNTDEYLYIGSPGAGSWNLVGLGAMTPATASTLGSVMIGSGITVTDAGSISVGSGYPVTFYDFNGSQTTQAIRATGAAGKKFSIEVGETTSAVTTVARFETQKLTLPNGELDAVLRHRDHDLGSDRLLQSDIRRQWGFVRSLGRS